MVAVDPRQKKRIAGHIQNLDSADSKISQRAEYCLGRYYGDLALSELLEACRHPNPVVRFRAVWVLGATRNPEAFEEILRLTEDPDSRVRYDATLALGVLGDPRAIPHLVRLWLKDDIDQPGGMALYRLGAAAAEAIAEVYRSGPPDRQIQAIQLLGDFALDSQEPLSIQILTEALANPKQEIREEAAEYLSKRDAVAR